MGNASKWWVDMDRRTPERKRNWTYLAKALLRRHGEKLDESTTEWRVRMRRMISGKPMLILRPGYATCGQESRVLLAQFYCSLDKTTKKLVKQHFKPRTMEEAVKKATDIDDPMDNVAQGMMNIGKSWATAPSRYVVPMDGTTGQTSVIPGVSGTGMGAWVSGQKTGLKARGAPGGALFTNHQDVYTAFSVLGGSEGEGTVEVGPVPTDLKWQSQPHEADCEDKTKTRDGNVQWRSVRRQCAV
ncbi:LOW QUALITY PROTEIN: hypothetical protein PHMEG_0008666 [Phytophthora megakarya]|uniref:Uncharacterized protein n=1 Tax=Phytophthora megakarya TaxID=4795 RepID=A0A225WI44_9STRA|nr:LOW QUALITY PROTEIN: hypothetical protein PHMEG_0008666 [Phytophthora megakarya]